MYLPLVGAQLPQAPGNAGANGLGFAKVGFRQLMELMVSGQELRIGASFSGPRAVAIAKALAEARRTIVDMPANYTSFPNSDARVFQASPVRTIRGGESLALDCDFLSSFGRLTVPGHVWRTLQRADSDEVA